MYKQQGGFYRQMMELAIAEMKKSIHEKRNDKTCPSVGAVLVRPDGEIITAYRGEIREGDHAEYTLLDRKLRIDCLDESILFTTLEPCLKRNHPKIGCAHRIINARIKKVWVGIQDPNPEVDRMGIQLLRDNGIEVEMFPEDLQKVIKQSNADFIAYVEKLALMPDEEKIETDHLTNIEKTDLDLDYDDLDPIALEHFRSKIKIGESINSNEFVRSLIHQRLMVKQDIVIIPTGIGTILFGKNPRITHNQAGLMAKIIYPGGTVETRDFDEPMVLVPNLVEGWYNNKMPHTLSRDTSERKQTPTLPYEVIREAIVNALIHRDYDIKGAKCQLELSKDKIIVKSPGLPVYPITLEQMKSFTASQLSRNPRLHHIFNAMDLAEEKNFGMDTLKSIPTKYNLPIPKYSFEPPYLVLTIFLSKDGLIREYPADVLNSLIESELKGWEYILSKQSVTRSEYEQNLEIDDRTAQRHLNKFIDLGLIKREGNSRATKYVLVK
jgi:ATP-dependent DNA helicase RecG